MKWREHACLAGVFIWSPKAFKERQEVQERQKEAHQNHLKSKVT